ncbi:MAG: hypothetical protein LC624_03845 [Halobacteriales archaeon]|nr:hypothetical protein [Halobacteriales archaeon]
MRLDVELRASLLAGSVAGLLALAGFALVHALLVNPRVGLFLLGGGVVPGWVGGVLAGLAYHEATAALAPRVRGVGLGAMLWAATVPAGVVGALAPGSAFPLGVPLGLAVAALLGASTGRAPRAAIAMVLGAALPAAIVAAGAGIVGGGSREGIVLAAMLPILVTAGWALQAARPRILATLVRRARAR